MSRTPNRRIASRLWLALALVATAIGIAGIVIPLLPTTPFLLVAAWAASRGSPKFRYWLEHHPCLGPPLMEWRENRAIRPRIKVLAVTLILVGWLIILLTMDNAWVLWPVSILLLLAALFIVTRAQGDSP